MIVDFEAVADAYARAFDARSHSVFSSPQWLAALPKGSVKVAVFGSDQKAAYLPFSLARRRGIPFVSNPAFTPWVEVVGGSSSSKRVALIGDLHKAQSAMANELRRLGVVRLRLQRTTPSWLGFHWAGYFGNARISYVVDGSPTVAWDGMKGKNRTQVRSAAELVQIRDVRDDGLEGSIELFLRHSSTKNFGYSLGPTPLRLLMADAIASGRGIVRGAFDPQDRLVATAFFVDDGRSRTYLMGAQDPDGARAHAMTLLHWRSIEETLNDGRTFDFEGSMLPGVEEYVRSFGGEQVTDVTVVWIPRPHRAMAALRQRLARSS